MSKPLLNSKISKFSEKLLWQKIGYHGNIKANEH